ncbi:ABC transporter permease [Kibdelosporangium phytohabitans]|uniref:Transport permease protein n=1 Tax=Kibdelosporangium phytohabitans TaxID=860235 RepID=A0A0N9HVF0_9PSEU|nr:ABC transporter permease [Kibdelosporangium phytohabitans]ALG05901.1 ABC transporter [Kibdelosporangium phytohabitans]MBE1466054.1 oleandomycin transport system permease protein [Kibdelosporangium phytohabitans]
MTTATVSPVTSISPVKAIEHGIILAGRNLRKTLKSPEQLIDVTIMPVIMLLMFVYLFGGAIGGGDRDGYLQMLLPGLMAQTILFATLGTGVGLCTDITKGVFDRFRSMPIARSAPLFGAVLGDAIRFVASSVFLLGFGMILGFDITTDAASALLAVVVTVAFGLCLCWISAWVGMLVKSPQAVPGAMIAFIMPLGFVSNVFVQTGTLPAWLKAFADIQPVSLLAEVNRGLLTGGPVGGPLLGTLAWMAGFVAVFYPLAMVTYRRRVA